jgi:hypothetical protein
MRFRILALLLLLIVNTSCKYFTFEKKSNLQAIDTIIDFSSVDASPTFLACKDFIEKEARSNCFRTTIHKNISESLAKHQLEAKKPIDEIVSIDVIINNQGIVSIKSIQSSDKIKAFIKGLDSIIRISVKELPTISPATKRGIPVATQYRIPIQIQVN